jgi:molybdopterin-guanine dinucleotide biosynthesis protein A
MREDLPDGAARITGVILAGGRGRRMGGVDKGLQELRGRPLLAWVIERFGPQVDELLINTNQNGDRYAVFGHRVLADQIPDFAGPLAGLHAALTAATHSLLATVPCDAPFLPDDLVLRLLQALTASGARPRRRPHLRPAATGVLPVPASRPAVVERIPGKRWAPRRPLACDAAGGRGGFR